ncbi:unnamed protein product, partial [Prorocentrum cordatum]
MFSCDIAKSACFGGHVTPAVPSKRAPWVMQSTRTQGPPGSADGQMAKFQAQIKRLERELEKAKLQQSPAGRSSTACQDDDGECELAPGRDRIAATDKKLGTIASLAGGIWSSIKADLRAERQAEQKLPKPKMHENACRNRVVDAEKALQEADARVSEQEQLLARLNTQRAALASQGAALAAPSSGASTEATVLQLGSDMARLLLEQGLDELGVQVPDLWGFAITLCEQIPQCSQQALARLEAPVSRATLRGATSVVEATPSAAPEAPEPDVAQMRSEIAAGGV